MKGCLVVLGFVVVSAALALGVTIAVERTGASKEKPLTAMTTEFEYTQYRPETHSGGGGAGSTVDGANIEYRYQAAGQWFASQSSMWMPLSRLSKAVCFDPDDPALHAMRGRETTCGEDNHGTVRRAKAVAP